MLKRLAGAYGILLAVTGMALAQAYPAKPITMIIPFAAGGPTDVLGRVMAQRMSEILGQQVVVENVGGAGGMTGAKRVADACRYPPVGKRSMGGGLQQLGFASMPLADAARIVNEETLVVVMIESPQGVAQCEEIAAVKGVDALLIGTNDLCFEMGIPGQFNDPRVAQAYQKVIAACRKHGKFPGMGGMYTPELLERHIAMGVQLVLSGSDYNLIMTAGKQRADLVRGFEKK